jgi:hypothetical protein
MSCLIVLFQGNALEEPFQHGLGNAIQWYDQLRTSIEREVTDLVDVAWHQVEQSRESRDEISAFPPAESLLASSECAASLQRRCLACFGGSLHGRNHEE